MATVSQILDFVQTGTATVNGYTVYPVGASGVDNAFVKLVFGNVVEYYAFSLNVLRVIALADEAIVPSSENTNIVRYDPSTLSEIERYSKDAKGVLQYEGDANETYFLFYVDPSVTDTSLQTFTTDPTRYSTKTAFNITVVNSDNTTEDYAKTSNSNIIQSTGSTEQIYIVYDDLGFLQAATDKVVGTDGITRDVVVGNGIIKYIKSDNSVEYYRKAAVLDSNNQVTGSLPYFKQVNRISAGVYEDIAGPITWREYGTPDPDAITTYQFATNSNFVDGSILVSGGYVLAGSTTPEPIRTFVRASSGVITEEVAPVTHFYSYTNAGFYYSVQNAPVGDMINDIRNIQTKPSPSTGIKIYEVVFPKVLTNQGYYYAYEGHSTSDINVEIFANTVYSIGNELHYMDTYANSPNLSKVIAAYSKRADGLVNNLTLVNGAVGSLSTIYEAYKNIGVKSSAILMNANDEVTLKNSLLDEFNTIYVRDASSNVLQVKNSSPLVYIAYDNVVSRLTFANASKYIATNLLKQRTVDGSDATSDIVFDKLAPKAVNNNNESIAYAYNDLGLLGVATTTRAFTSVKLVYPDDTIESQVYIKYRENVIRRTISTFEVYYDYTGNLSSLTLHEFTTDNVTYPVTHQLNRSSNTTGEPIDWYIKQMNDVTEFSGKSPKEFLVYSESAKASAILEENVSRIVPNNSLVHLITVDSTSKLETSRLTHVKRNPGAARITTTGTSWEAHSNRGLEFIADDAQFLSGHSATLISTSVVYSYYARNVLLNVAEYISYKGAVTRKNFATDKISADQKYAESATLKQRTVASDDSITDINFQKSLANMANHLDALKTYVYGDLGLLSAATATVVQAYTTQDDVKLVTGDNIVDDGVEVIPYTKVTDYENTLRMGATKYYEYNNLASLTLYEFTTNSIYFEVDSQINKQNTTTGAHIESYDKVMIEGVSQLSDSSPKEFFVYNESAKASAILEENTFANIINDSLIHLVTVDEVTKLEISRLTHVKRNPGAARITATGSSWEAHSNRGLEFIADDTQFVSGHSVTLISTSVVYSYYARNVLLNVAEYISYKGAVTRKNFATDKVGVDQKYAESATLKQRTVASDDSITDINFQKSLANMANHLDSLKTYVYGELGLLSAATATVVQAYTTLDDVKLVTQNNIIDDGVEVVSYTKLTDYANTLRLDTDKYYEYNNLASLTLHEFTTNASYFPIENTLYKQNTTTGANVESYTKKMIEGVSLLNASSPNQFFVYNESAKASAILEESDPRIVDNDSLIHLITVDSVTKLETARLTHVKRNPGAARITTTGTTWEAHSNRGLEFIADDTQFIANHSATLISTSVVYSYYARNVLLNVAEYISYKGAVTRKNFATDKISADQKYADEATLKQRTVASDDSITDINFQKSLPNMVNHLDALKTYVYGELGLLSAATATVVQAYTTLDDVKLVTQNNIVDDGAEVVSYTKLTDYANTLRLDTDKYYEYNNLVSLTLHEFTTNASYFPVENTLYKQSTSTGANIESYTKKMIEGVSLLNTSSPNQFFVYNESAKASAILEESDPRIIVNDSLIHLITVDSVTKLETARLTHVKRNPGAARITATGTTWEAHSNRGLEFIADDAQFLSGHSATLIATSVVYSYYARNVLLNVAEYISYKGAVTRKNFATDKVGASQKYAEEATLKQRTVASDDSITDINFQKSLPNMVNHLDALKTYVYGEIGLLSAATATLVQAYTTLDDVKLVTGNNIVDDGVELVSYTKLTTYENTLRKDADKYYEYNDLVSLTLYEFTINVNFAEQDVLYKQNTSTGANIKSYTKTLSDGVTKENGLAEFFVYTDDARKAAINENRNPLAVAIDSIIHYITVGAGNLEASRVDYIKRHVGASQSGSSWEAFNYLALAAIASDVHFLSTHSIAFSVVEETKTYLRDASNVLLEQNTNNYVAYDNTVLRKAYATNNVHYEVPGELRQRLSTTASNVLQSDVVLTKLGSNAVNRSIASVDDAQTYVYGDLGKLTGATVADAKAIVRLVTADDVDGDVSAGFTDYTKVSANILKLENVYEEYNDLDSLNIRTFATTNTYNDNDELHKMDTVTGSLVDTYSKVQNGIILDVADLVTEAENQYYVYVDRSVAADAPLAKVAVGSVIVMAGSLDNNEPAPGSDTYIKKALSLIQRRDANDFYAFDEIGLRSATVGILSTDDTVEYNNTTWTYVALNLVNHQTTYLTYPDSTSYLTEESFAVTTDYLAGDELLHRSLSSNTTLGAIATDITITKLDQQVVNTTDDATYTHVWEIGNSKTGLKNAAQLIDGSIKSDILDKTNTVPYVRVERYLLKKGANEYLEYNNLETLTLETFTTGSYNVSDILRAMNVTTGVQEHYYTKVLASGVSKKDATTTFFVFSEESKVSAIVDTTGAVNNGALINKMTSGVGEGVFDAAFYRRYLSAAQSVADITKWEAYSYLALANVSADSTFANGHSVDFKTPSPISLITTYDRYAPKVLKDQNVSNSYVAYDSAGVSVVSEASFATTNSYGQVATLRQRLLTATDDSADIVINKLDYNLVNNAQVDSTATHAYGDLGLRNAAIRSDATDLLNAKVKEVNASAVFTYIVQYVLQDASNNYYEYNALLTITLENFTTKLSETIVTASLSYPVGSILHKRDTTSGAKINDYTKVMAGVSQIDSPPRTFYTFSVVDREAAIDQANNAIVPSSPPSTIYQIVSGVETVFYKTATSTAENLTTTNTYEVGTYYALGQLAIGASDISGSTFDIGETVKFTDINKTYTLIATGLLREVGTQIYIAYDGAVSRETFATTSYVVGATLIQRSSALTTPDTAVTDNDIVLSKIADSAVNRATNSLVPVYEDNTYAYTTLGLLNSAITATAKTTVKLVTQPDVANDGAEVVNYTKVEANVLRLDTDKYYDYSNLVSLSISRFVSQATYNVFDTLHKMNTTTGVEITSYEKRLLNVAKDENNYYYVYGGDIVPAIQAPFANVPNDVTLILTSQTNEPTLYEFTHNTYTKRDVGLLQIALSWEAYSLVALASCSANANFLSGHSVALKEASTPYSLVETYDRYALKVLKVQSSLSYLAFDGIVSESQFAKTDSYGEVATLIQRESSATDTTNDVTISKIAYDLVNTSADTTTTHAYGPRGLRNAAIRSDATDLKNATVIDKDNIDASYLYKLQYILEDTSGNYHEYNTLATITLRHYTLYGSETVSGVALSYPVGSILYAHHATTGVFVNSYTKILPKISKIDSPAYNYYVFSINDRIAAIDEDGTLIPISPRSTIHQILLVGGVDEETIYYKTQVGGAQDSRYPNVTPDYEVNSYYALGQQVITNTEFVVGDTIKFTDLGLFYEKVADKIVMELGSSPPKYIAYDNILSREGFATSSTYAVNSILIQRSSTETTPDDAVTSNDIVLTKIAINAVNRGTDSLNTTEESVTYAYGTLGLLGSARTSSSKSIVRLVTASDIDGDADTGVTNYDKVQANVLKLGTVYQEYDDLTTITLRAFATTSSYNNDDILKRMSTTDGSEQDAYIKILSGIMKDAADQAGEEAILFYTYNALADAANAPLDKVAVDDIVVDVTGDNEPDGTDMMNKSYVKKTLGLLRKNMTLTSRFFAFSHIGLFAAATGFITTGQTVDYDGTRWSYDADNLLKASTTYITFTDASNSVSEIDFATLTKYVTGDSLTQRTIADLTSTSSLASDVVLTKLAVNVVNTTADVGKTHSYETIGFLNAGRLADDSGVQNTIIDITNSIEYTRVVRYILLKVGTNQYYEFSEFATITLRTFATNPIYMVGGVINKVNLTDGTIVESFTKYAADIILEAQGEYYCYVEASLATIANEDETILPVGTVVYEMVSNNEHTASDLPWTKTERYVLRANHLTSNKQYKVYNNSALPLDEFACAVAYAESDRIIQTFNSPYTIYDRKATSILDKDGDATGRYYSFYYNGVVPQHLELKESASNTLVQVGDVVITMAGEEWTKDAEGILLRNGIYLTFEGSSLGASSFATGSYTNGSLLRLITDISANSSYYMKNLTGVLYNSVLDQYETYGSDGLKNAAQSEDLVADRTPSDLMIADAEKIELNVLIVNIATSTSFYKIQRYVLKASSAPNYYDYSLAGNFGTISLESFATDSTYVVTATLQDMISTGGTWSKEYADVIKQSSIYYSYSDAGNAWTASNGTVNATLEEKVFNTVVYSILEKGVLLSNNIYYAYDIVSDANGLTLLTFSTSTSTYTNITLVDRTSSRTGVTYIRHSVGLLKTEDNNYLAMNATGLQTYATTTISGVTPSTTVVESSAGSWPTSVRVTYTLYLANILKNVSNSTLYVYNLTSLSLNTFATSSSYAISDVLVDRSTTYNGPNYKKMIAGVLERKATLTAFPDIEMLTFENDANGVKGLENASLAEVGDISDGTILIPDIPTMPKYLRCAKALLRSYMSQASNASFDDKALLFEQSGTDSPLAILSTVALNTGLVGNSQIPSETKLYVQPWNGIGYNTTDYAFVKDSAPFTNTIRVGTSAISDKITYAPANGTRASVLANFCELDSTGSRTSSNSTAVYAGKTITVRASGDTIYSIPRRGLLLNGSNYYAFSQFGLVAAAVDADTVLEFYYYYTSGSSELLETYKRIRKGLLLSSSQVSGQAGLTQSTTAILYYNDYSTNPDDNPANMYFYLYKLATQGSVGGATSDDATFGRDASGSLVQTALTGDSIIDGIQAGTITSLYGIVTTVGGIASAQRYTLVPDISNALLVDNLDSTPDFYLAYGSNGLNGTYEGALDGLRSLTNAPVSVVPSNAVIYTADRYAVYINNSFKYTKIGEGVLSAPGGVTFTYNATGLSVFANQALSTRSSTIPKGVVGTDTSSQSRVTLLGKTYFWWERGVVMYIDASGNQVFEVYPPNGPSNFVRRVALAKANGGTTADFNDSNASNPAFVSGTVIIIRDEDDENNTGDITYTKVDEGLIRHSAGQHYAFNNYGIASAANQSPAITNVIEMGGNINPLTTTSPVWSVMAPGVIKNSTTWRLYTNSSKASGREYFVRNSNLSDTMSYFTYSSPNTTTLQNAYTNVFDGTVNTVNTALVRIAPVPAGEKEFQTYGNAGLALVANNNVSSFLTNKTTDFEVYAITADASNNTTGIYRKLQDGALYTGTINSNAAITLFNDNLFQQVLDRMDIVEFVSLNANNEFATKTSATALNLSPLERLIAKGSELSASSTNITINGTTYSTEQVLERDILSSGSYVWTSELPASPSATDEVIASVTVTNKNGSVMTFRYRRSIRPVSIVS